MHHRSEYFFAWHARKLQIGADTTTDFWQHFDKLQHSAILRFVAHAAELFVIPILFATSGVGANSLQVPARIRTDPNIIPRWRQDECSNPFERRLISNSFGGSVQIVKPSSRTP